MNSQEPVAVACAANAAYALPMAVMLRSALDQLSPDRQLVAWIVDDNLGGELRLKLSQSLTEKATVHWLSPSRSTFDGLPIVGRMPVTTYDKLMIAELLPADVGKIIWLDCDMLVLADIAELWEAPMGDSDLLAVVDSLVPTVSSRFGIDHCAELGIDEKNPYFNAGVMVLSPARWRAANVATEAVNYLKGFRKRIYFWDQQALNAVLAGRWAQIDSRWNWSATQDRIRGKISKASGTSDSGARIVHFNGNLKPWVVREQWALDSAYYEVLDKTAWRGWRPARTLRRSMLAWYGSSALRRLSYPAEQVGMHALWRLRQRNA